MHVFMKENKGIKKLESAASQTGIRNKGMGKTGKPYSPTLLSCALWLGLGFLSLILSSTTPLNAQSAQAFTRIDSVTVGDRFEIYVVTTYARGGRTRPPQTEGGYLPFGDVELTELKHNHSVLYEGGNTPVRIDTAVYEAAAFAVDSAFVASIPIRIIDELGDTTRVNTPAFYIPVRSLVPVDAAGIYDLTPLAEFPRAWWPWVLGAFLFLLIGLALWYYLKKRQHELSMDLPPPLALQPY
jgi:hypothetical protein